MPRKKQNARINYFKPIKNQSGVTIQIPDKPYRQKGDIHPGWITAVAWPKAVRV